MEHKFTHLGQAPCSLVGYEYDPPVQTNNGYTGGTHECDHCGTPISHVFICHSSDGKTFNLGSVHVEQLGDKGLTLAVKSKMREVKREARMAKIREQWAIEAKHQQEYTNKLVTTIKAEYARLSPELTSKPHPNTYFASQGKTMLDYVDYFVGNGNWNNSKVISILKEAGATL